MEHILNPSDNQLQDAVEAALRLALPSHAPHVGVAVDSGSVTLTGELPTREEWELARAAALNVEGVHALADDILVRDARSTGETDTELAQLAHAALQRADGFTRDSVVAEVRDHVVTLLGTVPSSNERLAAERAVIYLSGLTKIFNRIKVITRSHV